MPVIRALALHIRSRDFNLLEALGLLKELRKTLETEGVPVWTLRISLGEDFDWRGVRELCGSEALLAAYHKQVKDVSTRELTSYLKKCGNGYATILALEEDLEKLSELYMELTKDLSEDYFTRIGVSYGKYVETPYFPISTALSDSISAAYRYADLLATSEPSQWRSLILEFIGRVNSVLRDKAGEVGLKVRHDLSLSPWMNESVVDVIEKMGVSFPRVGTLTAIRRINNVLAEVAQEVDSTGFNEIMLPVAEDNKLKEHVKRDALKIEDLIAFSTVCVAGLDMVAVPRDFNYLKNLLTDTYTAYLVKKKPYGVRVIPTEKPVVSLSRFGELPRFSKTGFT
ncbi:MAG: DUF711 family protein [Sulfolobales archaeon]|nr:DUF711 family protein [Sulfolobales archaeon]MDW8011219.1 DUF711 family protein [Sulfolobales archaeon]